MIKPKSYVEVSSYDKWKTVKKFLTGLLLGIAPTALLYTINFLEQEEFPEEYAVYIPLAVAILHAAMNLVKHYNDTILVDPTDGEPVC